MTLPNFLVIGAAKAGTTALYAYLKQHPQIYLTPFKETKFFAYEGENVVYNGAGDREKNSRLINNLADYEACFENVKDEKAIGEVSPLYIYIPKACERIKRHVPHAKMFAILRNPVDRAYSSFLHLIRDGRETHADFASALSAEPGYVRDGYAPLWYYRDLGFYYGQVKRYLDAFSRDQVRIHLYEDFNSNPVAFVQEMCRVLEIDDTFVPDVSRKWNVSGVPKNQTLHRVLSGENVLTSVLERIPGGSWLRSRLRYRNLEKPPFPDPLRQELIATFRADILMLQDTLKRDLSHWLV
jgi:hypothetical protein